MMSDKQRNDSETIMIRKRSCDAMLKEAEQTYSRAYSSLEYFFRLGESNALTRERIIPLLCEMTGILHQYITFLQDRMGPENMTVNDETGEKQVTFLTKELLSAQGLILMLGSIENELKLYNVPLTSN